MLPLIERSVAEHDALKDEAGIAGLFRRTGWIDGARSQAGLDQAAAEAASLSSYGLKHQVLDRQALTALEPALSERMVGGSIGWTRSMCRIRERSRAAMRPCCSGAAGCS